MERRCNLGRRDNCDNCEVVILGAGLLGRSRNMGASLLCWDRIVGYSGKWNKVAVGLYRDRNGGGFGRESKVIVSMGASLLCWDRVVGYSGRWNKVAVGLYRNRNVGSYGMESKVIVRIKVAVGLSRNRNVGGFGRGSKVIVSMGVSLLCWDRIVGSRNEVVG